jgi:hypothetical protein
MSEIIHLVSNFILGELSPFSKPHGFLSLRFIANLGAFFFLVFGYVIGCRALYHYLEPQWGEVYSLLALVTLLFGTSLFLFFIGWLLKPKEPPIKEFVSNVERALSEVPNNEIVKKIMSQVSAKTVASVFAVVVAMSYFMKSNKKI